MDKLLEQVAQTLKIPTDALQTIINNYPQIRHEYAIYKALSAISGMSTLLVVLNALISGIFAFIILCDTYDHEEHDNNRYKTHQKMFYISIATLMSNVITIIACDVTSAFMAPDINLVKDLINR